MLFLFCSSGSFLFLSVIFFRVSGYCPLARRLVGTGIKEKGEEEARGRGGWAVFTTRGQLVMFLARMGSMWFSRGAGLALAGCATSAG